MKKITFVCAMVMLVAFALPAQAAVQNVKVSGDITIRGIYQQTFDLNANDNNTTITTGTNGDADAGDSEGTALLMSTVGVNIEADLTDNVSAKIRLVNQRDWNAVTAESTDVDLDLAYITLKEMLYSPLTLIIGRQDLWYGDGFIIGANRQQRPPITAQEFTEITSFDAIRAILDYDPWTIDLLYAKIDEGENTDSPIRDDDDTDLYGVNVGYVFGEYDAEAEAYWFLKFDQNDDAAPSDEVHTIGIRGSVMPLENLDLRGEIALQAGDYNDSGTERDRKAWALNLRGEYCWADYAWMPTLGVEYAYLSGEEPTAAGDYEQFDPMYRGKTWSAIREWQGVYYEPDDTSAIPGNVNEHQLILDGSIQPTDNILAEVRYLHFFLDEDDENGEDDIGDEVDLRLTYEYTEDVTFGLLAAWFFPGDIFNTPDNDTAAEVVGTVSLVF